MVKYPPTNSETGLIPKWGRSPGGRNSPISCLESSKDEEPGRPEPWVAMSRTFLNTHTHTYRSVMQETIRGRSVYEHTVKCIKNHNSAQQHHHHCYYRVMGLFGRRDTHSSLTQSTLWEPLKLYGKYTQMPISHYILQGSLVCRNSYL